MVDSSRTERGLQLAEGPEVPIYQEGGEDMGSFGNAGTRTVRTSQDGVQVNLTDGEHLNYKLTALGAVPVFNLSCEHRTLFSETDFGAPRMNYEREWPKTPSEKDSDDDVYVFSLSFFKATNYTLVVERHDKNHKVLEVLKDIDYASNDPGDAFREPLRVFSS